MKNLYVKFEENIENNNNIIYNKQIRDIFDIYINNIKNLGIIFNPIKLKEGNNYLNYINDYDELKIRFEDIKKELKINDFNSNFIYAYYFNIPKNLLIGKYFLILLCLNLQIFNFMIFLIILKIIIN